MLQPIQEFAEGKVLLIDKPIDWTSFDVVAKIRGLIRIPKVGHAGTLDPLATGLLIICTGKYTKKINEYMNMEKEYTGSFTMGATTPTYDLESEPENFKPYDHLTIETINALIKEKFLGELKQIPPMFSAIKKDGQPLYLAARKGIMLEVEPRNINIIEFEITNMELPLVNFRIVCTTGTYIRSIAQDIGQALGCGAYLSSLCRTRIGTFLNADAISVKAFEEDIMNRRAAAKQNASE